MDKVEYGCPGYAVVDVEALLLGPVVRVVEQVGFVLISAETGAEVLGEKHIIYQPYDTAGLCAHYGQPLPVVEWAVSAYKRITGDDPVHTDPGQNPSWSAVRTRIRKICRRRAIKVYAKGAALERTVFSGAFEIADLEWCVDCVRKLNFHLLCRTGCPKYPGLIHDPLCECRYFAQFIPELMPPPTLNPQ
jgi:hypothetical protein